MEIFIDSADTDEIRQAADMGVIDGVTTNPSLVAKTNKRFHQVIEEICKIIDGPISAEVTATDRKGIVEQGKELAAIHPNIVVKVPLIAEGLKAVGDLAGQDIRTNVTLCFSASQALLTAKAGATYVSPFVGRIDDISGDGMQLIEQCVDIYAQYGMRTKVLAASIRHPVHFVECALLGADASTIPFSVIQQLIKHPLTDAGLERFMADAKKIPT